MDWLPAILVLLKKRVYLLFEFPVIRKGDIDLFMEDNSYK